LQHEVDLPGGDMTTNALIGALLRNGSVVAIEAAQKIAELEAKLEEIEPRAHATEYELNWLVGRLRDKPVNPDALEGAGSDNEKVITWKRVLDGKTSNYVAAQCPRLEQIMKGELPSLKRRS
jgi:hypothetical protein